MSEGFEFAGEAALASVGVVDAAGEVARAQVAVGGGLGEYVPDDHDQGVGSGDCGLLAAGLAEAAELGADVGAGAPGGPGVLDERRA